MPTPRPTFAPVDRPSTVAGDWLVAGGVDVLGGRPLLVELEFEAEGEPVSLTVVFGMDFVLGFGSEVAARRRDTSEDSHIMIMPFA